MDELRPPSSVARAITMWPFLCWNLSKTHPALRKEFEPVGPRHALKWCRILDMYIARQLPITEPSLLHARARSALLSIPYTVWACQQETPNLGRLEIIIGVPSPNNLEHRLLYRIWCRVYH